MDWGLSLSLSLSFSVFTTAFTMVSAQERRVKGAAVALREI